ncbi:MAG: tRNA epoxyqueuosine(34) reductase QueG [Bacteroidia bacterium]
MKTIAPSVWIKQRAKELGFHSCGISQATFLEEEASHLERWLKQGMQGKMGYMENHFDKRLDPRKLVDGARTVVSLMYNYYAPASQTNPDAPKISRYAYGEDYHQVLREKLKILMKEMQVHFGEVSGRGFVDSAPVLDRAWAARSGLGWIGKNANLINKGSGSFFFLCELIVDLEMDYDTGIATNHCGTCTACIDACPTKAIVAPKVVDGSKCISYFTIELKEEIPKDVKGKMDNWMFGCDVCQDVCPWNRFSLPHREPRFEPNPEVMQMSASDWEEISEEKFKAFFKLSPVSRTGYNGLKRNIDFLKK